MRRPGALLAALLALGLLWASPATAAYQQVGNFAGVPGELHDSHSGSAKQYAALWPEEVQLGGVSGMAVNYTGAGGVPAGTVYAASQDSDGSIYVARFNPDRSFSEAWVLVSKKGEEERVEQGKSPYERCGPEGEAAYPHCLPRPELSDGAIDVDVDQTTGNVYALDSYNGPNATTHITEYSADGSEVIARFGERAAPGETIAASPGKLHESSGAGGIAVNGAGDVYVFDSTQTENFYHRLAVFKPKAPGDYTEYVYAGQAHDIGAGPLGTTELPTAPVTDAAGNVYTATETGVEMYEPAKPASPVCSFKFKKGGIASMTVNPKTGETFFYSYIDRKVHRLNPCAGGKFSEAEAIAVAPSRQRLSGMAVDPERSFGSGRPVGILYAGAPTGEGGESKGFEFESSMGYVFAPPVEVPPAVVSESVSAVTPSSARLEGQLDPKGNVTDYAFQYITDAAYQANEPSDRFAGALEVPPGGGRIEGSKVVPVAATVSGLKADTDYHYRIRATSHCAPGEAEKECVAEGVAKAFRTYPLEASDLPDQRAWELVSPAQKNGGQVLPAHPDVSSCPSECKPGFSYTHFPLQSAPDGNAIAYEGTPFSFDEGGVIENQYIARRGATGWQTVNPTPLQMVSKGGGGYQAFKADLSEGVLEQQAYALSPAAPAEFSNLYTQPSAEPGSLTPFLTEAPPNREPGNFNGLRLSFAGASADFSRLFFSANDALTEDAQGGPEAKANLYERSGGELHLVNFAPGNASTIPGASFGGKGALHAISQDGSRAFWSSEAGQLYVRIDGEETREASDHTGRFLSASVDGSKALLNDGCLYGVEAEACEDLTGGNGGFEGALGQSDDLSRVYFVDSEVLSGEEENSHGDKAQKGKDNLYAWVEGTTTYLATLLEDDNVNPGVEWSLSARVASSPSGNWFAFLSMAPLTGFDNVGPCEYVADPGIFLNAPCAEVFLYQAQTGELRCPSCNRTGAQPRGHARPPAYLTDSGRLFFDTQDSLSAADTNGKVEDVYEFEPNGVGGCASEADCVSLISAGRSGVDSNFLAADASGRNVFFTSRDRLVAADKDQLIDLYDAREGGGFPAAVGAAECQGEACLPSVSAPNEPMLGSLALEGPGSPTGEGSGRCPKGRHMVRRKGKARCVKSQAKKDRHHKRHHNRGGQK